METDSTSVAAPKPALSIFDAVMITTGIVIGSGIFAFPQLVAALTGSLTWMYAAWLIGAALCLIGALCYAELAAAFPHAGGDYHFLTLAYGRDVSFFFGWARVMVITTGSMALGGYVFGDYMSSTFLSFGAHSSTLFAALVIVVLTAVNIAGLRQSARSQNVMTSLLVIGILGVALASLLAPAPAASAAAAAAGVPPLLATALLFVLFTFGGWNEAAYISAEVKGGRRIILAVLVLALALITAVYLAFIWALVNGLGFDALKASKVPGAEVMRAAFGPVGAKFLGGVAALAALTTINATMIVGARTNYALGRDWPIVAFMSTWDGGRNAPVKAFLVQGAIALALVVLAGFEKSGVAAMVEFTAPVFWFFFMLTGVALIVLRFRRPNAARPFLVPLYPILPIAFIATCAWLFYSSVTYAQSQKAVSVAFYVMGAGFVAWLMARQKKA
jgi:APA family basic amino acid/polyamine antiporter